MPAPAPSLAEVADELYGLPPEQFTAQRDAQARAARAAGRRDDAAQIRKLTRPTASAWLVNQLARAAPEPMSRLFELADALAQAQRSLAGDKLRELSARRRSVVAELLPVAASLAREAGRPASDAVLGEVRATLEAALADAGARDAVRSGRLTRALAYAGLGEVDLSAALAVPPARSPGQPQQSRRAEEPAAAERAAARRRAEAQKAVDAASEAVRRAEEAVSSVGEQQQFLRRRISHLERELDRARAEEGQLAQEADRAQASQESAARDLAAAQAAVRDAAAP